MAKKRKYEDVLEKHSEYMNDGKHSSADWKRKNDNMMDMLMETAEDLDRKDRRKSKVKWWLLLVVLAVGVYLFLSK